MAKPAIPAVGSKVKAQFATDLIGNVGNMAAGVASLTVSTANTAVTLAVSFPSGRFVNAPAVTTGIEVANPQAVTAGVLNVTATGFTMVLNRTSAGTSRIYWTAVETP